MEAWSEEFIANLQVQDMATQLVAGSDTQIHNALALSRSVKESAPVEVLGVKFEEREDKSKEIITFEEYANLAWEGENE